jgi:small-conductance mechanosensitive channel
MTSPTSKSKPLGVRRAPPVQEPTPRRKLNLAGWLFTGMMLALLGFALLGQVLEFDSITRIAFVGAIIGLMFVQWILGPQRINSVAPWVRASGRPMRSPLWARVLFVTGLVFFAYWIFRSVTESSASELIWFGVFLAYMAVLYWASWRIERMNLRHQRYRPLASIALLIAFVSGLWMFFSGREGWPS